jgi:imidazolonepropionase
MDRVPADFVIDDAALIATCAGAAPRRGPAQHDISPVRHGSIAAADGRILYVGPAAGLARAVDIGTDAVRVDARGCVVVPGFVDAHTHVVFAGDRRQELQRRLAGATYAEIAADGGGIARTVEATRRASEDELVAATRARLDEMLACGTTTAEAKSGYGLTTDSELQQLRVIRRLDAEHPIDLVPTFMGAHDVPVEYRVRRREYVSLVINEMIPRVRRDRLAEWCDVFCETGVFTPDESTTILKAGAKAGLKPRIHADELGASGGSRVAAHVGARSADHLLFVDEEGADAMAAAGVCATLLPAAAFYLKIGRFAPARMLIERGVPVALATDVNPGGGFSPSMPFAITLACFAMRLTLEEALVAATINAAWSVDRANRVGSLEVGKLMDAVILNGELVDLIRVGGPAIRHVIKAGRIVHTA